MSVAPARAVKAKTDSVRKCNICFETLLEEAGTSPELLLD